MRLFTVAQRSGYAPMIGGLGYLLAPGNAAYKLNTRCSQGYLGADADAGDGERDADAPSVELPAMTPSPTRAVSSPRVLSDLFWMGRYAERAENMARLLIVTRERYHEFRYRQELAGQRMRAGAAGRARPDHRHRHRADGDDAEMIAIAPTTLWSLTVDRHRSGSLAQSVERLGLAARAVRDQMSNDTWMVLAAVERAAAARRRTRRRLAGRGRRLPGVGAQPDPGRHAGAVGGGRRVDGARRRLDDDGHRQAHRARPRLTALLRDTLTTVRSPGAEQTITESTLVACESSVIYRRRTLGKVSVAAVADLVLFDEENPRSLVYQLERLRADLKALPGSSGSSRPERLVDEIATRLRRLDPADLEDVDRRQPPCRARRPARRDARRPARPVRRHHRDAPVAARRHAAAVGTRRAPGDAVTAFPDGPTASGSGRCYQVTHRTAYHVLRRRHQLLRPRLPHTARLRAAALPVARAGASIRRPRTVRPAATGTATSARTSTSPSGTAR